MTKDDIKLLKRHGWEVECESPEEIRHTGTNSFATLWAVSAVIQVAREAEANALTKWFMCYTRVYHKGGRCSYGHHVYSGKHPVQLINEWNELAAKELYCNVLMSFKRVAASTPDADVMSNAISIGDGYV